MYIIKIYLIASKIIIKVHNFTLPIIRLYVHLHKQYCNYIMMHNTLHKLYSHLNPSGHLTLADSLKRSRGCPLM